MPSQCRWPSLAINTGDNAASRGTSPESSAPDHSKVEKGSKSFDDLYEIFAHLV